MASFDIVLLTDSINAWFMDSSGPRRPGFMWDQMYERTGHTVRSCETNGFTDAWDAFEPPLAYGGPSADELHLYDGGVGGASIATYDVTANLDARVNTDADLVIIALGVNGATGEGTDDLIDGVTSRATAADVVCIAQPPDDGSVGGVNEARRDAIQTDAATKGVYFLDLWAAAVTLAGTEQAWCDDYTGDGTHPNTAGYTWIAEQVAAFLEDEGLLPTKYVDSDVAPAVYLNAKNYSGSGDWQDESAYDNDCVLYNSPTFKGDRFAFNGVNQYGLIADAPELDMGTGDYTVIFLAKPTGAGVGPSIVNKRVGGQAWWAIDAHVSTGQIGASFNNGSTTTTFTQSTYPDWTVANGARGYVVRNQRAAPAMITLHDEAGEMIDFFGRGLVAGDISNSTAVAIANWDGTSKYGMFDLYGVAIYQEAISDRQAADVWDDMSPSPAGGNSYATAGMLLRTGG